MNVKQMMLTACMVAACVTGQTQTGNPDNFARMTDFLPPPPNAAAVARAGIFGLNKNTGAPAVNLPLYTLRQVKLAFGLGLTYSSSGIKADEIASRAGMGWSMGSPVVTRTVRGQTDENNTRHYPWAAAGVNWATYNYMKDITTSPAEGGRDGEPDLFSFNCNGYSGSFVFDAQFKPVLLPYSPVKISTDFSAGAVWNFKITTPDGVRYYFGGAAATENIKRVPGCGKNFNRWIPAAWYLQKMEHPNGETIRCNYTPHIYEYDNGLNETQVYHNGGVTGSSSSCVENASGVSYNSCRNMVNVQGVLLSSVLVSGDTNQGGGGVVSGDTYHGGKIVIDYTTRPDCSDKLISRVELQNAATGAVMGGYNFGYTHYTAAAAYNSYEPAGMAVPYLTSLTELGTDGISSRVHYFAYDDPAARPRRLSYAQDHWGYFNGKNNTTLVPAIGYLADKFPLASGNREPDAAFAQKGMLTKIIYPTGGMDSILYEANGIATSVNKTIYHEYVCGVTGTGQQTQVTRTIPFTVDNTQTATLDVTAVCGGICDGIHQIGAVEVVTAGGISILPQENIQPGTPRNFSLPLTAGSYTLILRANGAALTTNTTLKYRPVTVAVNSSNAAAGGVRVRGLLTGNPGERPQYKRYYYGTPAALDKSSMRPPPEPVYVKNYTVTGFGPSPANQCSRDYISLHSNTLAGLYDYGGIASYSSVVESSGEHFEGGGTQSTFITAGDNAPEILLNNDLMNAPKTNNSLALNGKPATETILKKGPGGLLLPQRKTSYAYTTTGMATVPGYVVNQRNSINIIFDTTAATNPWLPGAVNSYDMVRYEVKAPWTVTTAVTDTVYNADGSVAVSTLATSRYDNPLHAQLTQTTAADSRGKTVTTEYKYPHDMGGQQPYTDMVLQNMLTPVTEVKTLLDGAEKSRSKNVYQHWSTGNYAVAAVQQSIEGGPFENMGTVTGMDAAGNITEFTSKDGIPNAVLWGYGYTQPVAKINNATLTQATAALGITVTALQTLDGTALRAQLATLRSNLTQGAAGAGSAFVADYTYTPLVGLTAMTDAAGRTTTYQYDAFNRLATITDFEGRVIKKNSYGYATPDPNAKMALYLSAQQSGSFTCGHCAPGYTGSSVTYTVPERAHFSLMSQADADAKAVADLQTNGQDFADRTGYCSNAICGGPGYKMINCYCEKAQKICVSAVQNSFGNWVNTYYYRWSDGSTTATVTDVTPPCVAAGYKRVGCDCKPGVKVYTASVPNGNGTYTCTYHLAWSDGTRTADMTEVNNAPCGD